ncbi:CRISPR-associated endoribonuclease Cas6 [Bacteroidota bacterium]
MRIRIIFILKNKGGFVPFHHQYILAQLVKGIIIKGGDQKYLNYADYNFSGLKGQTKISRNGLHFFSSKVTLVFASMDQGFIDYFLENLFELPQIEIGNLVLVPESVEEEKIPKITEEMKFICISPLVLIIPNFHDNQGKKFIPPEVDDFSDFLYETTIIRMERSGLYTAKKLQSFFKFQVVPDVEYLRKIREGQKKFARIYPVFDQDVKYEIRGYTLPFTLYASADVQKFAFISGLGAFTNKGFGMLDIANVDPTSRTKPYKADRFMVKKQEK